MPNANSMLLRRRKAHISLEFRNELFFYYQLLSLQFQHFFFQTQNIMQYDFDNIQWDSSKIQSMSRLHHHILPRKSSKLYAKLTEFFHWSIRIQELMKLLLRTLMKPFQTRLGLTCIKTKGTQNVILWFRNKFDFNLSKKMLGSFAPCKYSKNCLLARSCSGKQKP